MITVTSRERPSSRDVFELNHRNADLAVLEHRAKRLHLTHDTWGELGARRIKITAHGARQVGTLLRFLVDLPDGRRTPVRVPHERPRHPRHGKDGFFRSPPLLPRRGTFRRPQKYTHSFGKGKASDVLSPRFCHPSLQPCVAQFLA